MVTPDSINLLQLAATLYYRAQQGRGCFEKSSRLMERDKLFSLNKNNDLL
jgi:hypothetical protein